MELEKLLPIKFELYLNSGQYKMEVGGQMDLKRGWVEVSASS
jgi:hypothetical protein